MQHEDQPRPIDPVYQFVSISQELKLALKRPFHHLHLQVLGPAPSGIDPAKFNFLRRTWPPSSTEPAYFTYAFFEREEFSPSLLATIREILFEDGTFSSSFGAYVDRVIARRETASLLQARRELIRMAAYPEDSAPDALHHCLLALYSQTPVQGGIPGTLWRRGTHTDAGGGSELQRCLGFLVETESTSAETPKDLPRLRVKGISRASAHTEFASQEPVGAGTEYTFLTDYLDHWFRQDSGFPVDPTADKPIFRMLWIPVFDLHDRDEGNLGMFLGWMFQFLAEETGWERSNDLFEEKYEEHIRSYLRSCQDSLRLVVPRLHDESMAELEAQSSTEDQRAVAVLLKRLHLLGGWDCATQSAANYPHPFLGENSELHVRLGRDKFEDPTGVFQDLEQIELHLKPRVSEFYFPRSEQTRSFLTRSIEWRLRRLHHRLHLSMLRLRHAEDARKTRTKSAFMRAHIHTLRSIHGQILSRLDALERRDLSEEDKSKIRRLIRIAHTFLSLAGTWSQYDPSGDHSAHTVGAASVSLRNILEVLLLPVAGIYWENAFKYADLESLEFCVRRFEQKFVALSGPSFSACHLDDLFFDENDSRRRTLESINDLPTGPTFSIMDQFGILVFLPTSKSHLALALESLYEIVLNAFRRRTDSDSPSSGLVAIRSTHSSRKSIFLVDSREAGEAFDFKEVKTYTVDEFLRRSRADDRYGLRSIASGLSFLGVEYRVGQTADERFIREFCDSGNFFSE